MKITKENLKEVVAAVIEKLPVEQKEWDELRSTELDRDIENAVINRLDEELSALLGLYLTPGHSVECAMPYNKEKVSWRAVKRCTGTHCQRYFCKKHRIDFCPSCGSRLM